MEKKRFTGILSHFLLKTTHLLCKADLTSSDQHDPATHVDVPVLQHPEVIFLSIVCIQDGTLNQNKKSVLPHYCFVIVVNLKLNKIILLHFSIS